MSPKTSQSQTRYGMQKWRYQAEDLIEGPDEGYGQKMRRLRISLGLSQSQVAKITGCNVQTIALWETGKRQGNTPEQAAIPRRAIVLLSQRLRNRRNRQHAASDRNGLVPVEPGPGLDVEPLAAPPERRVR